MELNRDGSPTLALTINITEAELEELAATIEHANYVALDEGALTPDQDEMLSKFVLLLRKALI